MYWGKWHKDFSPLIPIPGYGQNMTDRLEAYKNVGPFKVFSGMPPCSRPCGANAVLHGAFAYSLGKTTVDRTREYLMWRGMTTMECCPLEGPCNGGPLNGLWDQRTPAWKGDANIVCLRGINTLAGLRLHSTFIADSRHLWQSIPPSH